MLLNTFSRNCFTCTDQARPRKHSEFGAQIRLASLQQAISQALAGGVKHRELIRTGGWELIFAIEKGKTVLFHARAE